MAEVLWTCILKDVEVELSLKNEGRVSKWGSGISGRRTSKKLSHETKMVQIIC